MHGTKGKPRLRGKDKEKERGKQEGGAVRPRLGQVPKFGSQDSPPRRTSYTQIIRPTNGCLLQVPEDSYGSGNKSYIAKAPIEIKAPVKRAPRRIYLTKKCAPIVSLPAKVRCMAAISRSSRGFRTWCLGSPTTRSFASSTCMCSNKHCANTTNRSLCIDSV